MSVVADLREWWWNRGVSGMDRAVFFRTLGALFEAGLPIDRSLQCLAQQTEHRALAQAADTISTRVAAGNRLSKSMAEHPRLFSEFHYKLILTGEQSGSLGDILRKIATHEEIAMQRAMKVRGALMTPILVSIACLVMIFVGPPLILRGLLESLIQNGSELPWPTKVLIGFSNLLRSRWTYVLLVAGAIGTLLASQRFGRSRSLRVRLEGVVLALPVIGPVRQLTLLVRVTETLATSISLGVPLLQAVELAAGVSSSPWLQEEMKAVSAALRDGETLKRSFKRSPLFNDIFLQTVDTGERAGHLTDLLYSCAKLLREVQEQKIDLLTSAMEPAVLGIVGGVVAFTVVATMLPMVKMLEGL